MDIAKKPYEISLWEDVLVWIRRAKDNPNMQIKGDSAESIRIDPTTHSDWYVFFKTSDNAQDLNKVYYVQIEEGWRRAEGAFDKELWYEAEPIDQEILSYYEETKLFAIGSNSMASQLRAINPKFVQKINGEKSLTFTIYYQYIDTFTGEKTENPYVPYLSSERKVKLFYDNEWHDFIIKNIQENSESKAFTYTCKDLFVTELSKTGFEVELDNELENNMGTIEKLAEEILKDSDWVVKSGDTLKQYIEEPLYKITLGAALNVEDIEGSKQSLILEAGDSIYVFYSNINDKKGQWQLLCDKLEPFETNDDLIVDKKTTNYICQGFNESNWPSFVGVNSNGEKLISLSAYRGNRLVKQTKTKYDKTIDKFVNVYEDGSIYGFTESKYITSGDVSNYVANPSNFISTSGWQTDANKLDYKIATSENSDGLYDSFIEIDFAGKHGALVMNAGIGGNRSAIKNFAEGQKYVLRMKYKKNLANYETTAPSVKICEYHIDDTTKKYVTSKELDGIDVYKIFEFATPGENELLPEYTNDLVEFTETIDGLPETSYKYSNETPFNSDYIYMVATCSRSISETQLTNWDFKVGLFFDFNTEEKIYIEDVQVFPYQTYEEGENEEKEVRLCVPGGKLHSEIKTRYIYYIPDENWQSIKDLVPLSDGYKELDYEPYYEAGSQFTKVRSISAKESNRFNLLQELCETFQCWLKISVEHDDEGKIRLNEAKRPIKTISFVENIGEDNYAGFRYGVNSKSIQRTVDSSAIVSKMIVKNNANEFAPNGSCSIAQAEENPTGENFLLNFDHYVRHQLLDFDVITNDLYVEGNGYLGYYTKLKRLNIGRDQKINIQAGLLIDIMNYESSYTTYKSSYDNAVSEQLITEKDFCKLYGKEISSEKFASEVKKLGDLSEELSKYWNKWCQCQNVIKQHGPLYKQAEHNLGIAKSRYDQIAQELKELSNEKRDLWHEFYKKYSRFIQEGSWIKEDYVDPNLYYIDAESTLYNSTRPKVTYNISVIDISPLPGYEDYNFKIGDLTYIEDVEFFGFSRKPEEWSGRQPYREQIVVSEISIELDSSEKTQIKVQNYKTQFEDLFQRITAQTQQAEYHTGEYTRAASIVETNGTISATTLENSFSNNSFALSNARDQSVVWNEYGITTTSLANPSEMVRIISGGVFLSNDGGATWRTGITGGGINTSYLTAGLINTNTIHIMNGANAAFRWDEKGLVAYDRLDSGGYNHNKFVRFDHNGIYGYNGDSAWTPESLEEIHQNSPFALTWDGFSLKSNRSDGGFVRISNKEDIQVIQGEENERVKIGLIADGEYGIRISGESGPVLETRSKGGLWLKDALYIGADNKKTIAIGKLGKQGEDSVNNQVINAADTFVVYEDGTIVAKGTIELVGGNIGNVEITPQGLAVLSEPGKHSVKIDENGITIIDQGFKIVSSNAKDPIVSMQNGNLSLTGKINALEGGTIGGFSIKKGSLTSKNGKVVLNGETNSIEAEEIILGTGAKIDQYIKLGKAYIRNPDYKENDTQPTGLFIESGGLSIYDNGVFKVGENICIDGQKGQMRSEDYLSGQRGWKIDATSAEFNDAVIRGTLKTAVFSQGEIQSVGGLVLVRPASLIEEILTEEGSVWVRLENANGFNIGDVCQSGHNVYKINAKKDNWVKLTNINDKSINDLQKPELRQTLINYYSSDGFSFFKVGVGDRLIGEFVSAASDQMNLLKGEEEPFKVYGDLLGLKNKKQEVKNNIGIAINSSDNESEFPKQAITIFETTLNTAEGAAGITKEPKIKLGRMDGEAAYGGLEGYGLYAENVYLHGSLVTKLKDENGAFTSYHSGFNGDGAAKKDEKKILLWAGAKVGKDGLIDITSAPFTVDEEGNLFAARGTFEGSVISKSTIEASVIKTATLIGDGSSPALIIKDTSKGISFRYEELEQGDQITFDINKFGFEIDGQRFIDLSEKDVKFQTADKKISIKGDSINWTEEIAIENERGTGITIRDSSSTVNVNSNEFVLSSSMQYQKTKNGYDLYVFEEKE